MNTTKTEPPRILDSTALVCCISLFQMVLHAHQNFIENMKGKLTEI